MKAPDWIEAKDWARLTGRQKQIMRDKGPAHLRVMHGWLKGKSQAPRDGSKPGRMPRESQWFSPPKDAPRERKDHGY